MSYYVLILYVKFVIFKMNSISQQRTTVCLMTISMDELKFKSLTTSGLCVVVYVCLYVCMYVCMYVCIYLSIRIYV